MEMAKERQSDRNCDMRKGGGGKGDEERRKLRGQRKKAIPSVSRQ